MEPNRKLFADHLPFILHRVLVGAGSLWPEQLGTLFLAEGKATLAGLTGVGMFDYLWQLGAWVRKG
jgi:hypothetical protein